MPSSLRIAALAASLIVAVPALAQVTGTAVEPPAVEGGTADRVALVNACGGHKFETMIEVDPVKHRSTRVKLCSKPGATDADWVRTLRSAIAQFELRTMEPDARAKVIAELEAEAAKYDGGKPAKSADRSVVALDLGKGIFAGPDIEPDVPFAVTSLPPLPNPKGYAVAGSGGSGGANAAAPARPPVKPIRVSLKCLSRGQSGKGSSCDFFDKDTVLVMTAITGLDQGGTVRFLRRGEDRGTVEIAAMATGDVRRVPLPAGICRSVAYSKVEVQLIAPKSSTPGATIGPFGLRC